MNQSVQSIIKNSNTENNPPGNKSGMISDELIDTISNLQFSEVILNQKVDQSKILFLFTAATKRAGRV